MRIFVVLGAILLMGCAEPTAPRTDLLTAVGTGKTVRLTNQIHESVYFTVIEREFAALALVALCTDPVTCPRVPPRATAEVAYADIAGHKPEAREAIVLHWRLVPANGGGFQADSVRGLVTRLR